ncbi:YegP family protein [Paraflavitalea speifideaquila]|uniref:YegP family protein n=1 Tax=Paraflavitalea speifideaquila TaxID=3076558 RepID=UPI0028E43EF7|nr:YegP family protein [Paraflavitalea speifideiaquila]
MGKFIISKDKNGEFRFKLTANNGETILVSEGYSSKANCNNGIESVRTNSQEESRFIKKTASNGKYYFNLAAVNSQIIGVSEMYETIAGRDSGIYAVKMNAPTAPVDGI